jgi:hypothetical protein
MKSNCLFYVLKKYNIDQGYIVIRFTYWNKLKWFKWPHFLWLPNICPEKNIPCPYFQSFSPIGLKIKRVMPPPLFDGEVHFGDEERPDKK